MTARFPTATERKKRQTLLEMLDEGMVMVYVDSRASGVDLPLHLRDRAVVPLNLSHKFGLDIFRVGPLSVEASLSFGGERYHCVMPWGAIFACVSHQDGKRVVFADALPAELSGGEAQREAAAAAARTPETEAGTKTESPSRPRLRLLD